MRLVFEDQGWEDCTSWLKNDRKMLTRINKLIEDVKRDPFSGVGKPEPLKYHLPGVWSRRIDDEHRLVYPVTDKDIITLLPAITTGRWPVPVGRTAVPQRFHRGWAARGPHLSPGKWIGAGGKDCGSAELQRSDCCLVQVRECLIESVLLVRTEVVREQTSFSVRGWPDAQQSVQLGFGRG